MPLPPKRRGKDSAGRLPPPKPGAMEPPARHRCHVCKRMSAACVESVIGDRSNSGIYTCPSCLEHAGQLPLLTPGDHPE